MKQLLSILVLSAMLLSISGCAKQGKETVSLKVGNTGNSIKPAMVVLAHELGYYQEEGLNVTLETIPNLNEGITAVEQGKLDVLPLGVIPSCTFIAQGSPVVIFGGTISEGSEAVVTAENKDVIRELTDFKGKTVACVRPETGHLIMKNKMKQAGLDIENDVDFIELDGFQSVIEAVAKGEADVGFVNSGFGTVARKQGLEVLFAVGEYAPDAVCCRQTTSKETIATKRNALVSFQVANLRAYLTYRSDKEKTITTLMNYSGQDRAYVEACLYDEVMKITLDPAKDRIEDFYEALKDNGDIDAATPHNVADSVDNTIYKDALDEMQKRYPDDAALAALRESFTRNNTGTQL